MGLLISWSPGAVTGCYGGAARPGKEEVRITRREPTGGGDLRLPSVPLRRPYRGRLTTALTRTDPQGADREALIAFHTSAHFPFHVRPHPARGDLERAVDGGAFRDDDHDSWWLDDERLGRFGLVVLEDLQEPAPLFDLRIAPAFRGRGLGVPALRAVTDHVFRTLPDVTRFEGQTREDNVPMRRVFLRAGWVKEAHYREAWPVEGSAPLASVACAVLRRDRASGRATTFEWDDLTLDD